MKNPFKYSFSMSVAALMAALAACTGAPQEAAAPISTEAPVQEAVKVVQPTPEPMQAPQTLPETTPQKKCSNPDKNTPVYNNTEKGAVKGPAVKTKIKVVSFSQSNTIKIPNQSKGSAEFEEKEYNENILWYDKCGTWSPITLSASEVSVFDYNGPQTLVFYVNEGPSENNHLREACRFDVDAGAAEVLAVIESSNNEINVISADISDAIFKNGNTGLLNMTNTPIEVYLNNEGIFIEPHKFAVPQNAADGKPSVIVKIDAKVGEKTRTVYQNNVFVPLHKRNVILVYDASESNPPRPSIQIITL